MDVGITKYTLEEVENSYSGRVKGSEMVWTENRLKVLNELVTQNVLLEDYEGIPRISRPLSIPARTRAGRKRFIWREACIGRES